MFYVSFGSLAVNYFRSWKDVYSYFPVQVCSTEKDEKWAAVQGAVKLPSREAHIPFMGPWHSVSCCPPFEFLTQNPCNFLYIPWSMLTALAHALQAVQPSHFAPRPQRSLEQCRTKAEEAITEFGFWILSAFAGYNCCASTFYSLEGQKFIICCSDLGKPRWTGRCNMISETETNK